MLYFRDVVLSCGVLGSTVIDSIAYVGVVQQYLLRYVGDLQRMKCVVLLHISDSLYFSPVHAADVTTYMIQVCTS